MKNTILTALTLFCFNFYSQQLVSDIVECTINNEKFLKSLYNKKINTHQLLLDSGFVIKHKWKNFNAPYRNDSIIIWERDIDDQTIMIDYVDCEDEIYRLDRYFFVRSVNDILPYIPHLKSQTYLNDNKRLNRTYRKYRVTLQKGRIVSFLFIPFGHEFYDEKNI